MFQSIPPLLGFTAEEHWAPGIGDPTVIGWVTVVAYFAAAWLSWRAARHSPRLDGRSGPRVFWTLFTVALVLLGINKQLDLQTWFTLFFKQVALHEGWYERRRPVQAAFIGAVALSGIASLAGMKVLARQWTRPIRMALIGGVFLGCFILIRASSFHHVDQMLGMDFGGIKVNWILELGGIAFVAAAAWRAGLGSIPTPGGAVNGPNFIWVSAGNRLNKAPNRNPEL